MKKIVTPLANGGAPFTNDLMETVFNGEIWTAMESILKGVSDPSSTGDVGVIVSGCKVTANGGNWDCSSGIVYMNGQFMAFPGFTNLSLPRYIVPASLAYIDKVWNNGTTNNLISQQDATVQSSAPGSGQYIGLTTTGNVGTAGGRRYENIYTKRSLGAWNALTLINGWANSSGTAAFRITDNLNIQIKAILSASSASSSVFATPSISLSGLGISLFGNLSIPVSQGSTPYNRNGIIATASGGLTLSISNYDTTQTYSFFCNLPIDAGL